MVRRGLGRAVSAIAGLALFILALELLKAAASDLAPLLSAWQVSGLRQSVGFGWLGAYVVLSGSPVAAIALTLYSSAAISELATLGMMTGSRLGASFIVLFVGFLYYFRGHRRVASVAIGVLAFIVTATIYVPALALGVFILQQGWLDGIRFGTPAALDSAIDLIFDPIVMWVRALVPFWGVFIAGLAALLTAFKLFDSALPEVDPESSRFGNLANAIYRPLVMFMIGALFTSMTLSVSVSLTLLVPLSTRGYIRRENVIPYIMGANITTFVDTLFASLLLDSPRAFTIVLVEVICVSLFSLLILGFIYRPYQRGMNRLLDAVLANRWSMLTFVAVLDSDTVALVVALRESVLSESRWRSLMNVLGTFDSAQLRAAQRTVALLAEKFVFDLDLLVYAPIPNLEAWTASVRGAVRVLKAEGMFEQAVAKACSAKAYDLVVAAPNDRRGLVRMVVGSRIGRLVGAAPATVWVPRGDNLRLRRIVVGVSGGPQSEQDPRLAARLAMAYDARLELVYVVSQVPLFYTTFAEFHDALENDDKIARMAPGVVELRRIHKVLADDGAKVEMVIRSGTVADVLVELCQGEGKRAPADLLVIGAHARSGYAGADYFENLAEQITEAVPAPTLVVHAKSDWAHWEIFQQDMSQ